MLARPVHVTKLNLNQPQRHNVTTLGALSAIQTTNEEFRGFQTRGHVFLTWICSSNTEPGSINKRITTHTACDQYDRLGAYNIRRARHHVAPALLTPGFVLTPLHNTLCSNRKDRSSETLQPLTALGSVILFFVHFTAASQVHVSAGSNM